MKTTFDDNTDEVVQDNATPGASSEAIVPQNANTEIVDGDFFDHENEIPSDAIRTPRLELTHAVGFAPKAGIPAGCLVYGRETILAEPTKTEILDKDGVTMIPLAWYIHYEEVVSKERYEEMETTGEKIIQFKSENEARKLGYISQKEKKANPAREEPVFHPILHVKALIAGNSKNADQLGIEFEGKNYAIAEVLFKKGAYWTVGTTILNHANEARMYKRPLPTKAFTLTAKFEGFKGSRPSWNLRGSVASKPSPTFVEWAKQFV